MKLASNTSASFLSESREDDEIDFTDYSAPFLSGHGFSLRCHRWFSKNMSRLGVNPNCDNDCVYVKTDDLPVFFASNLVPDSFVLVTHNSDFVINVGHSKYYSDPRVRLWLAMNKGIEHPKLVALADGLQNPCYGAGSARTIGAFSDALGDGHMVPYHYKTDLFYANYTIDSHFNERGRCAAVCQPQGIRLEGRAPLLKYLSGVASAMFTMCPAGSGIDSCRPYEAIYLKSVPVTRSSVHTRDHQTIHGMPIVDLDDWNEGEFSKQKFSREKWHAMMDNFDPASMHMDAYCARLNKLYGVSL